MRSPHPTTAVARYARNVTSGRDLVVGDVHGEFSTLEHALEALDFQPGKDRLFSVGDLIDRGPRSGDALHMARGAALHRGGAGEPRADDDRRDRAHRDRSRSGNAGRLH